MKCRGQAYDGAANMSGARKRRAWYLPDDRHTVSLVGLCGGWRHARTKMFTRTYGSEYAVPGKGLVLPNSDIDVIAACTRYLILSLQNNELNTKSPFVINKALIGIGDVSKFSHIDKSTKSLNSSRGVISEPDLLTTPEAEILDGSSEHGVIQAGYLNCKIVPTYRILCAVFKCQRFVTPKLRAVVN
ncbi:hypothetical protein TNCV_3023201 [Trichonephila clavipes]|uniref:Uncharacterized protein n=1 Tax=Trichonephila clavipes TaxID=2585209 RepID=A0A8X6VAV2_TRICX|nr:hypothetical protein TNCV_3023201 [Trichonephila clavipes]